MKFTTKFLTLLTASLFVAFTFSSCDDDDSKTLDRSGFTLTIAEFIAQDSNYSSLVAALTATDLLGAVSDKNANLTVFAPDNDAFDTFLTAAGFTNGLEDVDTEDEKALVKNILLNHVLGQELKASDITAAAPGYAKNLATGPLDLASKTSNLSTFYNVVDDKVMINGTVEVTKANAFDANNGIIHAVKSVIDLPKISTFVVADERVSSLKDALVAQDLVTTIDELGTATVFAPVNDAFAALDPAPTGTDLTNALTYHVISGVNVVSTDVPGLVGTETPATVQGQKIDVVEGPAVKGKMNTENSGLVITDIQATNGVIHVIDRVLLPAAATATLTAAP